MGHSGGCIGATNAANGITYDIILNDTVTVLNTVNKENLETAKTTKPTLTITAYAVQQEGFTTPEAAWNEAKNAVVPTP